MKTRSFVVINDLENLSSEYGYLSSKEEILKKTQERAISVSGEEVKEQDLEIMEFTFNLSSNKIYHIKDIMTNELISVVKLPLNFEEAKEFMIMTKTPLCYNEEDIYKFIEMLGGEVIDVDYEEEIYW